MPCPMINLEEFKLKVEVYIEDIREVTTKTIFDIDAGLITALTLKFKSNPILIGRLLNLQRQNVSLYLTIGSQQAQIDFGITEDGALKLERSEVPK